MGKKKAIWYKILSRSGHSCGGGTLKWSLPKGRKPGDWLEVKGKIICCQNGLHLTTKPAFWYEQCRGWRIFIAEGAGSKNSDGERKTAFRRARLLREVKGKEKRQISRRSLLGMN